MFKYINKEILLWYILLNRDNYVKYKTNMLRLNPNSVLDPHERLKILGSRNIKVRHLIHTVCQMLNPSSNIYKIIHLILAYSFHLYQGVWIQSKASWVVECRTVSESALYLTESCSEKYWNSDEDHEIMMQMNFA